MPDSEYSKIPLSQGQYAIVDAKDYDWLTSYAWWAQYDPSIDNYYVRTQIKRASKDWPCISMHRLIMGLESKDSRVVDHINRNTLDNRRCNLRVVTRWENALNKGISSRNTSGYKGVSWRANRSRWIAQIRVRGKLIKLGSRKTKEEAYQLYCEGSKKYHGEFGSII
jgi:hypothetical protein